MGRATEYTASETGRSKTRTKRKQRHEILAFREKLVHGKSSVFHLSEQQRLTTPIAT